MIKKSSLNRSKASLLLLLQLVGLFSLLIHQQVNSLSISSSSSNKNALSSTSARLINGNNNLNQGLPVTTLSPLASTNHQHLDSLAHHQQYKQQQDELNQSASERSSDQHRLSQDEHDDSVPLATINNHSRNNQLSISRPPQYVDVSALVGVG